MKTQIKFALNLHLIISTKKMVIDITYGAFFDALVLMLLTKFVTNSTIRRCISASSV